MAERRNKFQIIMDILALIQRKGNRIKPTHVLYGSNLSHDRLKKYISELEEKGLVEMITEKNHNYYKITDKGAKFLEEAKKIKELTDAFGLS
jgi:predicted transcriptional regulator